MFEQKIIDWLMDGDIAIQYQVQRDLLNNNDHDMQNQIHQKGWGAEFLKRRNDDGHWGRAYYQPKWTSTHYTLQDLRNLCIAPDHPKIKETIEQVLNTCKGEDGGINPSATVGQSDVCINGMVLNFCSYFGANEESLKSVVDFILSQLMCDGAFNCRLNRSGATHSSLHTTISAIEGILEYRSNGYHYRVDELSAAEKSSQEFILQHRLFKSDKTGAVIDKKMIMLSYPYRWKYDILRALDYFQMANVEYENRMDDALEMIMKKRLNDGKWPVQAKHPGEIHFDMEKGGKASRWNTLRVLRILKHFGKME